MRLWSPSHPGQHRLVLPPGSRLCDVVELSGHHKTPPFSHQLHAQIGQDVLRPASRSQQGTLYHLQCCNALVEGRYTPERKDPLEELVEHLPLRVLQQAAGEHYLQHQVSSSPDRVPFHLCWLGNAGIELLHVGKDEVIGIFHGTIHCLSMSFNEVMHLAGNVQLPWDLAGANGVSVDWLGDLVLSTFNNPVSLNIIIKMLLFAVSGEAVCTACRADDYNRIPATGHGTAVGLQTSQTWIETVELEFSRIVRRGWENLLRSWSRLRLQMIVNDWSDEMGTKSAYLRFFCGGLLTLVAVFLVFLCAFLSSRGRILVACLRSRTLFAWLVVG